MNRQQMIDAARANHEEQAGYSYDGRLIERAIDEGLVDGDIIHLGGTLYAHIHGDQVTMVDNGEETTRLPLSGLTDQQRDRILVLKATRASRKGYSTGRWHS